MGLLGLDKKIEAQALIRRVAVLMTCYNRVRITSRCIDALKVQTGAGFKLEIIVVDDGSSDGTAEAVMAAWPEADVISGDGSLYWCGGMRLAFEAAINRGYDFYLWLNDDTQLEENALSRLIDTYSEVVPLLGSSVIVVGSVLDPQTHTLSYGGWKSKAGFRVTRSWEQFSPDPDKWIECNTMNGNCVLVPAAVVAKIGNLDPVFRQGMGDLDYGLRLASHGGHVIVAPGYFGYCSKNDGKGLWFESSVPLRTRWRRLVGPKGFPVRSWKAFTSRHKGRLWIMSFVAPYLLFWFKAIGSKFGLPSK